MNFSSLCCIYLFPFWTVSFIYNPRQCTHPYNCILTGAGQKYIQEKKGCPDEDHTWSEHCPRDFLNKPHLGALTVFGNRLLFLDIYSPAASAEDKKRTSSPYYRHFQN